MTDFIRKIKDTQTQALAQLKTATDLKKIDDLRVAFLGKKGLITALLGELKNLSLEEKKEAGPLLHALKKEFEDAIEHVRQQCITQQSQEATERLVSFDVTAHIPNAPQGHLHPYTLFIEEMQDIFLSMGFEIWDGP